MPVARRSPRFAALALSLLLPLAGASAAQTSAKSSLPSNRIARSDMPSVVLDAVLRGEFALQAGKLDVASAAYLQAATGLPDDAGLAERATRIALLANRDADARQALALWARRSPDAVGMHAARATLALRSKDAATAQRDVRWLLARPSDEGWRHALGVLAAGDDPALATRLLDTAFRDGLLPSELRASLAFAGLAQRLDAEDLAERMVADVVRRFPDDTRVGLLQVSQLRQAGKTAQARQALQAMRAALKMSIELRMAAASEYEALGDPAAAAAVLALGEQNDGSLRARAQLLLKAGDKPGMLDLYTSLSSRDQGVPNPDRRLLLGQLAEYLERPAEALRWYDSVPGGEERWQARLRAIFVRHAQGEKTQAFDGLRALQTDGNAEDVVRRTAYLAEAELRTKDGDNAGEMAAFAQALSAFPDDTAVLYARALAWERRDDIAKAEADLRRLLVLEPDNVAALNALGYTLADRTQRYAEALALIDRARTAEPDNPAIIDSYGWVLYRLGRKVDALVQLRRAYALQKDADIAAHVGEVLWMLGKKDEASSFFAEARKLDPDNRALQRALQITGASP